MFSENSEASYTQTDSQILVQALQYHVKSITTICANFYSHEELSTVLVELCAYIASKWKCGVPEGKNVTVEDAPNELHASSLSPFVK